MDGGHDAGAAGLLVGRVTGAPDLLLQAGEEVVDLQAGSAEAGDFYDGFRTEVEERAGGQGEEIEAGGEDVFAEVAGVQGEAFLSQLGVEFGGEEVDLREVGEGGVFALEVEMLRGAAAVGVAFDAFVGDEADAGLGLLGEAVLRV